MQIPDSERLGDLVADNEESGLVLTGLIGRGILESRTPWMHEQEAAAQGVRLRYGIIDFTARGWPDADLGQVIAAARAQGFAGLNVTFPFKQAVILLLDEVSEGASAVGAVNTIVFRHGRSIGYNTDVSGFASGFHEGLPGLAAGTVLQLGCGGAGSATAHALLGNIAAERLVLFDTDPAKAEALRVQLAGRFGTGRVAACSSAESAAAGVDGVVNATPVGMAKFPGMPIAAEAIEPRHWVADIVYFPLETALLAEARRKGCRTLDGSGMAVQQAADAFHLFTGCRADAARMRASFVAFAGDKAGADPST